MTLEKGNHEKVEKQLKIMMVKVNEEEVNDMDLKERKREAKEEEMSVISEISDFQEIQNFDFPSF